MSYPTIEPKKITVRLNADGTPECVPIVTRVRPGGSLIWEGEGHSGAFDGRLPGPPRDDFKLADFAELKPVAGPVPFQPAFWALIQETTDAPGAVTITVDANAESGVMYKYSITAGGRTLDPIIIVDNTA
jgi:hypothetical protein